LAADIIINEFGFKDYRLNIYGAKDRQPAYAREVLQIIADRDLAGKVVLAGFKNPKEVLKDAWLFVNSSLSEGLPLAIGEAALTGVPVVATEVGGTSLVLTDPDDSSLQYGEVVPPNDPVALARAQINVLAMLGQWAGYTNDETPYPVLPDNFSPDDAEWITRRMYEKSKDRRKLGLKCREVVLRSFHGTRYLREHEQMYWVQWRMARMRADIGLENEARSIFRFGIPDAIRCADGEAEHGEDDGEEDTLLGSANVRWRWQDFSRRARQPGIRRRKIYSSNSAINTSLEILRPKGRKKSLSDLERDPWALPDLDLQ
jgi:hypothetical protein